MQSEDKLCVVVLFGGMSSEHEVSRVSAGTFVDRGIMTPNEVRRYFNLEPLDGGDLPLLRKDTEERTTGGNS